MEIMSRLIRFTVQRTHVGAERVKKAYVGVGRPSVAGVNLSTVIVFNNVKRLGSEEKNKYIYCEARRECGNGG